MSLKREREFSTKEWIDVVLRSTGMEPDKLTDREKWLHLIRLVPWWRITTISVN